jgi:glycosyltransferase involved in cell wall biosynthesis
MPSPDVTVLIATRDRPDQLRQCVKSVIANDHPSFEVIVVEQSDGSNRVGEIDDERVRVITTESVGKTRALNLGLEAGLGDVVLFTDDDCTVPSTWITDAVRALADDPDVGLMFGPLVAGPHDPAVEWIPAFVPTVRQRVSSVRDYRRLDGRAGANMVATKAALQRIGPFDPFIGPGSTFSGLEEFDFSYRALSTGCIVAIEPWNAVVHWGIRPRDSGDASRLMSSYSYGEGAVLAKQIRCGDRFLIKPTIVRLARSVAHAVIAWVRTGTADGLPQTRSFARGVAGGLRHPLDRTRRLFLDRGP